MTTSNNTTTTPAQVDVRGPRFAAWVTTAVLIVVLVISGFSTVAATVLLALQAVVFAIGALRGPRQHPYGLIFAKLMAPRLSPVSEREPVPPLKFAQLVGFVFAVVGVAGFAFGAPLLGTIATAFALFAAFLNAAFGICLGCQLYPLVTRLRPAPTTT
ncbi:Integral membrane protein [uncultured Mycobacterium sp.]|uniref:Integral membrane protein n=1 Tax=uncultured Mycobacterium sp. TaxID=171292 RepID=A0A1Y5P875_9MYCO|nr:Integral membrane protein [uncultured Mycobacterium sp.]